MNIFFKKILEILNKYSSGKNVLFFFVVTQIFYGTMLFFSVPKVVQYSNGMKILDMLPTGYRAEYVQTLFQTLGETGRTIYLFQQIPLDMFYPGLFAISFSLLLTFIFEKVFSKESKLQLLSIVPIFGGLFDYFENIGIIVMLLIYPNFQPWIARITNIFSVLKSTFTIIMFALLTIGIIMFLIKKLKNRKHGSK